MKVETIPLLGDNYAYLVICEDTGKAAAVDPADANTVRTRAYELGVTISAIWNTHHHFDHSGGNAELAGPGVEVCGHSSDQGRVPGLNQPLEHTDTTTLGQLEATGLHTPGHTRGSICYAVQDALFTGDTLFGGGCGRLFEEGPDTMFGSLSQVLAGLPDQTRVFFGHEYTDNNLAFANTVEPGNAALQARLAETAAAMAEGRPTTPSTLGLERATNPFLRCDSEEIVASLSAKFPDDQWTEVQVFTRLRELRNDW